MPRMNPTLSGLPWSSAVGVAVVATFVLSCSPWVITHTIARKPGCIVYVDTDESKLALTIDDGPYAETTPKLLDVLAEHGAHATFFLISENLDGNEDVVRRLLAEGHEIGNHLTRDERSISLSAEKFESALVSADTALSKFDDVVWMRPGGGHYNKEMVETWEEHGYGCALGSVYPFDAHIHWEWFLKNVVLCKAKPGSIIILHDGPGRGALTTQVLSAVLPKLAERNLRVVTLSELVSSGMPVP